MDENEELPGSSDGEGSARERAAAKVAAQLQQLVVRAVENGVGPVTGSVAYADARLDALLEKRAPGIEGAPSEDEIERTIDRLIKEAIGASATNGFVTGLGGLVAMPVTLPANLAGALVINARLAGAVAYLRGYDLADPHVQTFVTLVAAGGSASGALAAAGAKVGAKLSMQAIKAIPLSVLRAINLRAGFMLVAKYGTQRSVITLAKAVPFVGGAVGGGVDAGLTAIVGKAAKQSFPRDWGTVPVGAA